MTKTQRHLHLVPPPPRQKPPLLFRILLFVAVVAVAGLVLGHMWRHR